MATMMPPQTERRRLQFALALACCVPLFGGLLGAAYGAGMFGSVAASPLLDSHVRYLSGLLLAIGLLGLSCVPRIETKGGRLGLVALMVGLGGLIRLYAALQLDAWSVGIMGALVMELVVTPGLFLWQHRVARKMKASDQVAAGLSSTSLP